MMVTLQPRGLTQRAAAKYMGVSVSYFREHVHVEPKPIGRPEPGKKLLLRYRIEALDAWMDQCAEVKAAPVQKKEKTA